LTAVVMLGFAFSSGQAENLRVALLLSGPANDGGWNAVAVKGLEDAEKKYGIETAYTEHVSVADCESAFTDYAAQGYDLVIGHGFQFGDPAVRVGKKFPKVKFVAIESNSSSENTASFRMAIEQSGYLMGIVAASMSKTGIIGTVGGMEVPSIVKAMEAYKLGAKAYRADIKVLESYLGSFTDVAKGKEAAMAMIDQKADVLTHVANQAGTGVIKAAESKGVLATGDSWDQSSIAPETIVCSTIYNVPALVVNIVQLVKEGQFKGGIFDQGMKDGVVDLSSFHSFEDKVPQDAKDKIAELKKKMIDGSFVAPLIEKRTTN
jgi:basic membrane protein A